MEELAQLGEGVAEDGDEAGSCVALAGGGEVSIGVVRGRIAASEGRHFIPVVAHGLEDGIIELDGSRDEERRTRHCGCGGVCSSGD